MLLQRFLARQDHLIAPDLIVSEFGHGLRKNFVGNRLTADDALAALVDFLAVPLERVPASSVVHDAWRLVTERRGQFYDAVYVALAQARGCTVIAADNAMENTYRDSGSVVPLSALSPP
jgi:predicted nucleic acid-binding protein